VQRSAAHPAVTPSSSHRLARYNSPKVFSSSAIATNSSATGTTQGVVMSRVTLTGDFGELAAFAKKLATLGKAVSATAKAAAPKIAAEIASATAAGSDAFGAAFAPRNDGGAAFASMSGAPAKVSARGTTIFARVTRKIPRFMNRGRSASARGGFMPPRPIVPDESSDVPPAWVEVLEDSAERAIAERMA
jgi:hypothetical protein